MCHTLNSILLCSNGGKRAISVAGGVCGTGRRRERIKPATEIAFPHEPHIIFVVTPLHSWITLRVMHYAGISA